MVQIPHVLLVPTVFSVLLAGSPNGKMPSPAPYPVTISIDLVTNDLKLDTTNVFKISVSNPGHSPVWVYKDPQFGIEIWVKTKAGKELAHQTIGALCPPPPPGPESFVQIQPGQSIQHIDERDLADLGIEHAGRYTAVAVFHYRVVQRPGNVMYLQLSSNPVVSKPVAFEVH